MSNTIEDNYILTTDLLNMLVEDNLESVFEKIICLIKKYSKTNKYGNVEIYVNYQDFVEAFEKNIGKMNESAKNINNVKKNIQQKKSKLLRKEDIVFCLKQDISEKRVEEIMTRAKQYIQETEKGNKIFIDYYELLEVLKTFNITFSEEAKDINVMKAHIEKQKQKYNEDLVLKTDLIEVLKEDFQEEDIKILFSNIKEQTIGNKEEKIYIHYNEFIRALEQKQGRKLTNFPNINQFKGYVKEKNEKAAKEQENARFKAFVEERNRKLKIEKEKKRQEALEVSKNPEASVAEIKPQEETPKVELILEVALKNLLLKELPEKYVNFILGKLKKYSQENEQREIEIFIDHNEFILILKNLTKSNIPEFLSDINQLNKSLEAEKKKIKIQKENEKFRKFIKTQEELRKEKKQGEISKPIQKAVASEETIESKTNIISEYPQDFKNTPIVTEKCDYGEAYFDEKDMQYKKACKKCGNTIVINLEIPKTVELVLVSELKKVLKDHFGENQATNLVKELKKYTEMDENRNFTIYVNYNELLANFKEKRIKIPKYLENINNFKNYIIEKEKNKLLFTDLINVLKDDFGEIEIYRIIRELKVIKENNQRIIDYRDLINALIKLGYIVPDTLKNIENFKQFKKEKESREKCELAEIKTPFYENYKPINTKKEECCCATRVIINWEELKNNPIDLNKKRMELKKEKKSLFVKLKNKLLKKKKHQIIRETEPNELNTQVINEYGNTKNAQLSYINSNLDAYKLSYDENFEYYDALEGDYVFKYTL